MLRLRARDGQTSRRSSRSLTHQVGESPRRIRGPLIAAILMVLLVAGWAAVGEVRSLALSMPHEPAVHQQVDYPSKLAAAMKACHRGSGDTGDFDVPVIGPPQGIFMRVVELRVINGAVWAGDPFNPKVNWRSLNSLERSAMFECKYAVEQYGVLRPREIMLTFDDGPTPDWTRSMLRVQADAERQYGRPTPFTYFIIGRQAMLYPDIVRTIVDTGNSIGNHSLTHRQFADLDDETARQELVVTSRALTAASGVRTGLAREPFRGLGRSSIQLNLRFMISAQQQGLTVTGYTRDTLDYKSSADQRKLEVPPLNGEPEALLLHDGGGNREATVEYLVRLVEASYAAGYTFVTADQLLERSDPTAISRPESPAWADKLAVLQFRDYGRLQMVLLIIATVLLMAYTIFAIVMALYGMRKWRCRALLPYDPKIAGSQVVSFLIAAWNEEKNIEETVRSVIQCYKDDPEGCPFWLQIMVVSDGSTDMTNDILSRLATETGGWILDVTDEHEEVKLEPRPLNDVHTVRVDVILAPHGGKAAALTTGLLFESTRLGRLMQGKIYLQTDADSVLAPRCIGLMARHFNDPRVGAVCGRIEAQDRLLTGWGSFLRTFQLADYVVGVLKRAFEQVLGGRRGSMGILPGCVLGARRDGLPDGVPGRTKAEDFLASLLIRRNLRGCEIRQEVDAVVYTEVPYTLRSALNQQIRWLIGPLQVVLMEWRMTLRIMRYGPLAWAVLPMTVVSWLSAAFLVPLTYASGIYLAFHGHAILMLLYYGFFIVIRMAQLGAAMHITREWSWARFFTCLYYRPLNDSLQVYVAWYGIWAFATGEIPGWTKPPRIGQATIREEVTA